MSSSDTRKKSYSDSLYTALDNIGVNQCMRWKYYESDVVRCIAEEILPLNENGVRESHLPTTHGFGSFIEGTVTYGMARDIDSIRIETNNVVEQGFEGTNVADEETIVVVTDMFTPPGFVKLKVDVKYKYMNFNMQQVCGGHLFVSNIYTHECKQNMTAYSQSGREPVYLELHGPALKDLPENDMFFKSYDLLIAFGSKSWLSFNLVFFNRPRHHGWPSQETLDIMKGQGCLFVPTGHRSCKEEDRILQWRISFSFQERHLMLNLNTAQFKCYVLLKLVKKHHIYPIMDLTSYHCKTALLYTIENTDVEIWKEDNILNCLVLCLKRITKWSRKRMCPSYFIPELNLFTGKIEEQKLSKLTDILTSITRRPEYYLQQISIDNFGKLVELYTNGSLDHENIEEKMERMVRISIYLLLHGIVNSILQIRCNVLLKISYKCSSLDMAIERHYKWLKIIQHLQTKSNMGLHNIDHIPWVLPHACRFLHSSLASHLALKVVKSPNTQTKTWHILSVAYHFWMGLHSDAYSGKMKLATFLLYTGYLSADALKSNYCSTLETQSICNCFVKCRDKGITTYTCNNLYKSWSVETLKLSTSVFMEKYVSACTIFLPTESELTLYPLKIEMHRRFGCQHTVYDRIMQTQLMCNSELDNCATLDSKVYYVLLMTYLSGKKERDKYMTMLDNCSAELLAHPETTWNVLGWFISSEEINQKSLTYYKRSWDYDNKVQNDSHPQFQSIHKNAAKWNMALLLYRAWFNKNK